MAEFIEPIELEIISITPEKEKDGFWCYKASVLIRNSRKKDCELIED